MKWKSLLATICLNIGLSLLASIVMEYADMTLRVQNVENSIQQCLDAAIDISTASEELFTDKAQSEIASLATYGNAYVYNGTNNSLTGGISDKVYARTTIFMDNHFVPVNAYQLARYYDANGTLPTTSTAMASLNAESDQLEKIYGFLFGETGQDYTHTGLSWANKSDAKRHDYSVAGIGGNRTPNAEFREYYNRIGKLQQTVGFLKAKTSVGSYRLQPYTYPVLVNMGLTLDSLNSTSSGLTSDNFSSSCHVGKAYRGVRKTRYYLTPASLGVTYVPVKVLKPLFVANLDTLCRLQRISGGQIATDYNNTDALSDLQSADGCIPLNVYDNAGGGAAAPVRMVHEPTAGEHIINNGDCEFDLNSVQVKVDYFFVDFKQHHDSARIIASKLNGLLNSPSGGTQDTYRDFTLAQFNSADNDTGTKVNNAEYRAAYDSVRMQRIVARVTVKMKVYMPYKSPVMQWVRYLEDDKSHYSVRMWDSATRSADTSEDGVWYKYTTYFCQTR